MSAPAPGRRLAYEPGLDGIRGVLVFLICGYHAHIPWASGSFIALTGFFVLSGYLITRLLLGEWERSERIDLAAFWTRRARRLLPAITLFLATLVVAGHLEPDWVDGIRLRNDIISTVLYANNWWQIAEGRSYFQGFASPSPLHHIWSLSLEEQWFLFFPLATILVLRRRPGTIALTSFYASLGLVSALLAALLFTPGVDPSRLYYGTDIRALEILIGTTLACATHHWQPNRTVERASMAAGIVALLLILFLCWALTSSTIWLYPYGFGLTAVLFAVLVFGATRPAPNPLRSALGFAPLRGLGIISYGFYLWHWPIFMLLTREVTGIEGLPLYALRMAVSAAVATVSYFALEKPIRRGAIAGRRAFLLALASSTGVAVGALLLTPASVPRDFDAGSTSTSAADGPRRSQGDPVLFLGDSIAWSLANGFIPSIETRNGIAVENRSIPGCGLAPPGGELGHKFAILDQGNECGRWPREWARMLEEVSPSATVVLIGGWEVFDREVDGVSLVFGTPEFDRHFLELLDRATRILTRGDRPVVLLTVPDLTPRTTGVYLPARTEAARIRHLNSLITRHAEGTSDLVSTIDLAGFLCDDGDCNSDPSGLRVRSDGMHFTARGARSVAAWLAPQIQRRIR